MSNNSSLIAWESFPRLNCLKNWYTSIQIAFLFWTILLWGVFHFYCSFWVGWIPKSDLDIVVLIEYKQDSQKEKAFSSNMCKCRSWVGGILALCLWKKSVHEISPYKDIMQENQQHELMKTTFFITQKTYFKWNQF